MRPHALQNMHYQWTKVQCPWQGCMQACSPELLVLRGLPGVQHAQQVRLKPPQLVVLATLVGLDDAQRMLCGAGGML